MTTEREQEEIRLVEELVERFLEDEGVVGYTHRMIAKYCEPLGIDPLGEMTELQQEVVCQFQLTVYHRILAAMIRKL